MKATSLATLLLPALALCAGTTSAQKAMGAQGSSFQENFAEIRVPGKQAVAQVWTERGVPHYQIALDGRQFSAKKATNYDLMLRFARFDPVEGQPRMRKSLQADSANRLMIVQYWTQGLEDYRSTIRELGGEIHFFLANHSNVVEMNAQTRAAVEALPFVRKVVPFHGAYKLGDGLLKGIRDGAQGQVAVNILVTRRGVHQPVIDWLEANGGTVTHVSQPTYYMTATLPYANVPALSRQNSVKAIDLWGAPSDDVNIARGLSGANLIENAAGYSGTGVAIEILDSGTETAHPDFNNFTIHNSATPGNHGTCVGGIVFGDGTGNAQARGLVPSGRMVVSRYLSPWSGGSRYAHSGELVNPALPYKCVAQTNSWGNTQTQAYNSFSSEVDTILFDFDKLSMTQSQSNTGNRNSRPQAWGKNIVAVGALFHRNTAAMNDDSWSRGASIGPAADGRIKPDMASFYDLILTADRVGGLGYSASNYFANFGGTSGATPIVAGCLGMFYEMWGDGLFGNAAPGTVFQDAPNNTLAKAFLITTASQWRFEGSTHDRTRTHQGWGHPNLNNMLVFADEFMIVDETDPLTNLQTATYQYTTDAGDQQLRATMVYRDPAGTTSSTLHRINNLDLKLTSPSGSVYHGNHALDIQPFSLKGGSPNNVDTVENVWVRLPEVGTWTIEVTASDVNQDTHSETGGAPDVDFALVVYSGAPTQG
jgi:hypothetical protein